MALQKKPLKWFTGDVVPLAPNLKVGVNETVESRA